MPAEYDSDSVEGRFLGGDPAAHRQVARWIAQIVTRPRFRILRDDWNDVHQDALRRIVESLRHGRFDASRDFRAYVHSIAWYTARDMAARKVREYQHTTSPGKEAAASHVESDLIVTRDLVRRILASMPEECRRLFSLYYRQQRSYDEIAELLGIPVGTVKSRLSRCLRKARRILMEPTVGQNTT